MARMVVFGVVVAALLIAGTHVARALWKRLDGGDTAEDASLLEHLLAGAVLGSTFWIAVSWILALTHTLTSAALWIVACVVIAIAIWSVARSLRSERPAMPQRRSVLLMIPIAAWTIFALWRGAVVPPASHDALAYHLPRALMMARAGGFEHFPAADHRLNAFPANYELLLADVILMSGSDRLTEWLSTAFFLFFLMGAAAMTQRWWRGTSAIGEVVIATAMTPLLLLHSSAHKNDLMAAAFVVTALLFGARWCARGGRMPMLLLVASLVMGGGTKPQVAAVLLAFAPFLIARAVRARVKLRSIVATGVFAIVLFAIGGAAPYAMLLRPNAEHQAAASAATETFGWGDFENLWQVPILTLMAPFSSNPNGVWVPWRGEYWFWPRYEVFFSNFGPLFTVLTLLLPIAILIARRSTTDDAARRERRIGTIVSVLATLLILPVVVRPVGFFAAIPRYLLFIVPVVVVWTIPPLIDAMRRSQRVGRVATVLAAALVIAFVLQAELYAVEDTFVPLEYVRMANELPGTRAIWFQTNRAASVVDRIAGPDDTIAIDGSFDTWIYPAYGAELTRNVILLPAAIAARDLPPNVQWVIVDRSWNALWGNPQLTDMGRFWRYIGRGRPTADDIRLYQQLLHDPRFRLVFRDPRMNQAVFWRIGSTNGREPHEWRGRR